MELVKLAEVHDEGELALLRSLLDGNGIAHFVRNEHFGSLYPGVASPLNGRIILVPETEVTRARALLKELTLPERNLRLV